MDMAKLRGEAPPPLAGLPEATSEPTLGDALQTASRVWARGGGAASMVSAARRCVSFLGPATALSALTGAQGFALRDALLAANLSDSTVINYQRAFHRMLQLSGFDPPGWPAIPSASARRGAAPSTRERAAVVEWLCAREWRATADLVLFVAGTGLCADVEARRGAFSVQLGAAEDWLTLAGPNGRDVPVVDPEARALLRSAPRLRAMRDHSYSGHVQRLGKAAKALGFKPRHTTFRAFRSLYRQSALQRHAGSRVLVADFVR